MVCLLAAALPAQRLPFSPIPEHYTLHLSPDFSTGTFQGEVGISVRVAEATSTITLNAAEMQFIDTTISSGGTTQHAMVTLDPRTETATLTVPQPIAAGAATITIRYAAALNDRLRGFYLSKGNGRNYAVTQLEATDARRAFPCFDEPVKKATFDISATIDTRDTAISNGRVMSDTPGPQAGKHTLKFSTTPKMSTYLVALVVGDWACVRGSADRIPIRICASPNRKDQLGFALQSAEVALRYYNRYFTIKYPFEKLDVVGVPDFSAGAMENTAAIVFREQSLLVNADARSASHLEQVAQYMAHEISHQWFGDLVTPQWWDDVWLNEGFATWMERRPMYEWKPEWNVRLSEVRDSQSAMGVDALQNTRPVRTQVETPEDINGIFDAIAYQKTAQIVRMVEGYIGPSSYRDAINAYLKKFAYGNATGEGYWNTIAETTGKPVDGVLSSFITQPSLPLVSVKTACADGKTLLSISQTPMSATVPATTTWNVPVCYKRSRAGKVEPAVCELLTGPSRAITLNGCSSWIFANVESRGYYRTDYGTSGLKALEAAIRGHELSAGEETSLVEDSWALVRENRESIASFLSLAQEIVKTGINPVTETIADRINYISEHLINDAQRRPFEQWVRQLLHPTNDTLGWTPKPNEGDDRQALRSTVLYTLGYAGRDPDVLREARRRIDMYLASAKLVDPSLLNTTIQLAALTGDEALYNHYLTRVRTQEGPGGRGGDAFGFRVGLTFFPDSVLTKRTLEFATSPEVRTQDSPTLLAVLMRRPWAARDTWEHVKTHWDDLQKTGTFMGLRTIIRSTNDFCDRPTRDDIARFFLETGRTTANERLGLQSLETIDRCIAMREHQALDLTAFLKEH